MNDVARVDQARADAAADRCDDGREAELDLREVDLRVVVLDRRVELRDERLLRVELLLRRRVLRDQRGVALQVDARVRERGLVLGARGLGLQQLRLQRARVEPGDDLALLDVLAFREADRVELAVDACLDRHGERGRHRADAGAEDGHVLRLDQDGLDHDRRLGGLLLVVVVGGLGRTFDGPEAEAEDGDRDRGKGPGGAVAREGRGHGVVGSGHCGSAGVAAAVGSGLSVALQPPPVAVTSAMLAAIRRPRSCTAVRWLVSDSVCAVTTLR